MSGTITGELRLFLADPYRQWMPQEKQEQELKDALDAIDAVHANLERENASLKAELDRVLGEQEDRDEWVRLPVDADGVPWHIGDVTESGQEVKAMGLNRHGWSFVGIVNEIDPAIHHHHVPTVEDLLFSYGQACIRASNEAETDAAKQTMLARLREDYAAKLRLAEGEDAWASLTS